MLCHGNILLILVVSALQLRTTWSQTSRFSIEAPKSGSKSPRARLIRTFTLTAAAKDAIVNAHNRARSNVNPPAVNMRKITWDNDLEKLATEYTKNCTFAVNKDKKMPRFRRVEENLYVSTGIPFNNQYGANAATQWDAEKKYYTYSTSKCSRTNCHRYTQMVWPDTFKVGCGVSKCSAATVNGRLWNDVTLMVCDYTPGGNWITGKPYATGKSCSDCHSSDVCVNKLCTNPGRDVLIRPTPRWLPWTQWTACSKTCGFPGTKRRSRICNTFVDKDCGGYSGSSERWRCPNTAPCSGGRPPVSLTYWNRWGPWSTCSQTCGGGRTQRTRTCNSGNVADCKTGSSSQSKRCNRTPCPRWQSWRSWERCSKTCGGGIRIRTRACSTGNNNNCAGNAKGSERCNTNSCSTRSTASSSWNQWTVWRTCSATCGAAATRSRSRTCSGRTCVGKTSETEACRLSPCSVATFSAWSSWGRCSVTCGEGRRVKTRRCSTGKASDCSGSSSASETCTNAVCKLYRWDAWSTWTSCPVTCGGGTRTRTRDCIVGNSGRVICSRKGTARKNCNTRACPAFSKWSSWGGCSVTCGEGRRVKTRTCSTGKASDCFGSSSALETCLDAICKPYRWGSWSAWTSCPVTCGGGSRIRTRDCIVGNSGRVICSRKGTTREKCNTRACPTFSSWSAWGRCSTTCGAGRRVKTRTCSTGKSSDCFGLDSASEVCSDAVCQPYRWDAWSAWTSCPVTCGGGTRTRTRDCIVGNSGRAICSRKGTARETCNTRACPNFSPWGTWSPCSSTCGTGQETSQRTCSTGNQAQCNGPATKTKICTNKPCQNSKWAPWGAWSSCSQSCAGGTHSRTRNCDLGNSGPTCSGLSSGSASCNTEDCPTFLSWSNWGSCSVTCGRGTHQRTRLCNSGKSTDCTGERSQTEYCSKITCSLSSWNNWDDWSSCSKSCGEGQRKRTRVCNIGNSGPPCLGNDLVTELCNTNLCPEFSEWTPWSSCPVTCGVGTISRTRACNTGRDADCPGTNSESKICTNQNKCTVSNWSPWGPWDKCSKTCGNGTQTSSRICNRGNSGSPCLGSTSKTSGCNVVTCPAFGQWTSWSSCSVTCGNGVMEKTRKCNAQRPTDCKGDRLVLKVCSRPITCALNGNSTDSPVRNRGFGGSTTTSTSTRPVFSRTLFAISVFCLKLLLI